MGRAGRNAAHAYVSRRAAVCAKPSRADVEVERTAKRNVRAALAGENEILVNKIKGRHREQKRRIIAPYLKINSNLIFRILGRVDELEKMNQEGGGRRRHRLKRRRRGETAVGHHVRRRRTRRRKSETGGKRRRRRVGRK
jgi:hypothetical protein